MVCEEDGWIFVVIQLRITSKLVICVVIRGEFKVMKLKSLCCCMRNKNWKTKGLDWFASLSPYVFKDSIKENS